MGSRRTVNPHPQLKCSFGYATETGEWLTLAADADATMLTTDVAGGFVGATVGMRARIQP